MAPACRGRWGGLVEVTAAASRRDRNASKWGLRWRGSRGLPGAAPSSFPSGYRSMNAVQRSWRRRRREAPVEGWPVGQRCRSMTLGAFTSACRVVPQKRHRKRDGVRRFFGSMWPQAEFVTFGEPDGRDGVASGCRAGADPVADGRNPDVDGRHGLWHGLWHARQHLYNPALECDGVTRWCGHDVENFLHVRNHAIGGGGRARHLGLVSFRGLLQLWWRATGCRGGRERQAGWCRVANAAL